MSVYIFAYGSLIWDQPFDVISQYKSTLQGFARRYCIYSHVYRGTKEKPGLVLGLDKDEKAQCSGLVFEISEADFEKVYEREMVLNVYLPTKVDMILDNGKTVEVNTFIADQQHEQYAGQLPSHKEMSIIKSAHGSGGSNWEYYEKTRKSLQALGFI